MRAERMTAMLLMMVLALAVAGCGGGGGGGAPSLMTQLTAAIKREDPELAAKELVQLAYDFKKAGDASHAEQAANQAVKRAGEIKDPPTQARALASAANACGYLGLKTEAKGALKQAQPVAEKLEPGERKTEVLALIGLVYGKYLSEPDNAKYWYEKAEEAVKAMPDPFSKTMGLISIAASYGRWDSAEGKAGVERMVEEARGMAGTIPEDKTDDEKKQKVEALAAIASKLDVLKKNDEAKAAFDDALKIARGIGDPIKKGHGLVDVATSMSATRKGDALTVLNEAEQFNDKNAPDTSFKKEVTNRCVELRKKLL